MLSVLMTTFNGAKTLPNVLESFCQLITPGGGWELIIVNNGSTDKTLEIIESYRYRLPITVLYEPKQGQNISRNLGLTRISGDLVVFTDDDVLPQPDWLVQIRQSANANPTFSIFGGPILPKWETLPEEWLRDLEGVYLISSFTLVDPTLAEGPTVPDYVFSPNMAFRANIFKAGHRFDVTIGPDGTTNYPMGSETEFIERMGRLGFKLWYCKDAIVYHLVRSNQMNREWILNRAIRLGRGKYRIWAKYALNAPTPLRLTRYLIRQVITYTQISLQVVRLITVKRSGDPEKLFRARWWWNYYNGKAIESRIIGLKRQSPQIDC